MSTKEKGKELFCALNVILDVVSSLNLRDLEAEAKADRGESSSKAAANSSRGKDKVAEPDWEDISFNSVPITPLSSNLVLLRSLGLFWRQWNLLIWVRLFSALLVVEMVVVAVVLLVVLQAVLLVVLLAGPDGAPAPAGATAPVAAATAMAMAVTLEVALAALNNIPWRTTRRPSF
jgi:hypothetical protein